MLVGGMTSSLTRGERGGWTILPAFVRGLLRLQRLTPSLALSQLLAHSADMVRRGYFSHTSPDGKTPFDRRRGVGIQYHAAAENIAEGQETAEEVFRSWVNSPGHRKNIENPNYTHHGIGLRQNHWTHILIRPR